jgi:hypothetical protein
MCDHMCCMSYVLYDHSVYSDVSLCCHQSPRSPANCPGHLIRLTVSVLNLLFKCQGHQILEKMARFQFCKSFVIVFYDGINYILILIILIFIQTFSFKYVWRPFLFCISSVHMALGMWMNFIKHSVPEYKYE